MKVVKYFIALCISILFFSCAKEAVITNADFQKNLLAGTGNYQNTSNAWRLDSLTISGAPYKLSVNEKKYTKTFFRDGAYTDSDGYMGVWDMSTENKLDITTTNSINNVKTKSEHKNHFWDNKKTFLNAGLFDVKDFKKFQMPNCLAL